MANTRRLALAAITNLMCSGRKRGLAGVVAPQRLAKFAKNVAAEASNFLMRRTFLDIDMRCAADLLGMDRRQAERIHDLQRGQFLGQPRDRGCSRSGPHKAGQVELAQVYGSSSPGRTRRLLDHFERGGLINVRVDFAGERSNSVLGLEGTPAD